MTIHIFLLLSDTLVLLFGWLMLPKSYEESDFSPRGVKTRSREMTPREL